MFRALSFQGGATVGIETWYVPGKAISVSVTSSKEEWAVDVASAVYQEVVLEIQTTMSWYGFLCNMQ